MVGFPMAALKGRNLSWISWFPSSLRRWTCAALPFPRTLARCPQNRQDVQFKHWPRGRHGIVWERKSSWMGRLLKLSCVGKPVKSHHRYCRAGAPTDTTGRPVQLRGSHSFSCPFPLSLCFLPRFWETFFFLLTLSFNCCSAH